MDPIKDTSVNELKKLLLSIKNINKKQLAIMQLYFKSNKNTKITEFSILFYF